MINMVILSLRTYVMILFYGNNIAKGLANKNIDGNESLLREKINAKTKKNNNKVGLNEYSK